MVAVILGLLWIAITGLLARSQLNSVRAELPQLRRALLAGDLDRARQLTGDINRKAQRAHTLTTGPAWWTVSSVPLLGDPLATSRVIAAEADRLSDGVLPQALTLAQAVTDSRPHDATIDLTKLERLRPTVADAALAARTATTNVSGTRPSWLPFVSSARSSLINQLRRLDGELGGAKRTLDVAVPLLGGHGPQRFFVGFLNEAESRGVGGIPGAFAIATVHDGRIRFTHFGSDNELAKVRADLDLGAEYNALYRQDDPTGTFFNSDISPDFRDAARIWAGVWEAKSGEHVDAAVALDPTALSYLLQVTGPATDGSGRAITSDNVVALTQQKQYELYRSDTKKDNAARKRYLVGVARAASKKLSQGGDPLKLVHAASRAARERRFVVWSADPAIERDISRAQWGGVVEATPGTPYTGFVVINASGNKLDYYLDRSMTYERSQCNATSQASATFTVTNRAPAKLPPYVTLRADHAPAGVKPGDNSILVTYYGSAGARILSVTVDGHPVRTLTRTDNGLTTITLPLELRAGASRSVKVRLLEPAANAAVHVLRQPLVRPLQVKLAGPTCGDR